MLIRSDFVGCPPKMLCTGPLNIPDVPVMTVILDQYRPRRNLFICRSYGVLVS